MDAFVAAPNTYIVERAMFDGNWVTTKLPVVGWVYVQGTRAYPIAPLSFGGLTDKRAVLLPSGLVCDVYFDATFASLEEWENACDVKGPVDRTGSTDPASVIEDRKPGPATPVVRQAAAAPARKPKKVRTLQQKSFWGKKDAQVILIAEGGVELPDDRDWVKITRDEFSIRKRDGYVVWPDENGPGEPAAEEQAEEQAQEPANGFDGDDLI